MRFRNALRIIILLIIGTLLLMVTSSGVTTSQEKPVYKPAGSEATIVGTISLAGTPPKELRIDMSADPICNSVNPDPTTEWVVVSDQKLANVVIYLRGESLNNYSFETPTTEVVLEHKGCR